MAEKTPDSGQESAETHSEPSLDEALNDLEQILESQEQERKGERGPRASADEAGQYAIPLLDDVVMPGEERREPASGRGRADFGDHRALESDAQCQALIKRLTNEIEVIVQAGVEEALRKANKDIMSRVRKHVNITLPEILEEIAEIRSRKGP